MLALPGIIECGMFSHGRIERRGPRQPCRKAVLTPRRVRRIPISFAEYNTTLNYSAAAQRSLAPFLDINDGCTVHAFKCLVLFKVVLYS